MTRRADADAARPRRDDLRALGRGPPRGAAAGARRAGAAARRADPAPGCCAPRRPRLPEVSEPEIVRHYNRISRRNFDLDTGFYPLGSCTMKHNPKLNERVAALPGHARLHPLHAAGAGAGRARADVAAAALAVGDLRPAARQPPALGRRARRAGRPAADARLPRRPRRVAPQGADARHRARHEPRDGHDGRLRGREGRDRRARRHRRRRPAREGRRRRRLPDADEPEHARPVRRAHRGDRGDRARHRRDALLRRREPERRDGHLAAGRHGLRHRPREPAQVVLAAARRRRPGRRPDRGVRPHRAVPAAPAGRAARGVERRPSRTSTSTSTGRSRSAGCAASRATSACSCAPTPTSSASAATACARRPRPRC